MAPVNNSVASEHNTCVRILVVDNDLESEDLRELFKLRALLLLCSSVSNRIVPFERINVRIKTPIESNRTNGIESNVRIERTESNRIIHRMDSIHRIEWNHPINHRMESNGINLQSSTRIIIIFQIINFQLRIQSINLQSNVASKRTIDRMNDHQSNRSIVSNVSIHVYEWNRMESNGIEWNRMESNGM